MEAPKLKFQEISYEKLKNLGNFQNEKVSVTVLLEAGEDPKEVLDTLREWVSAELNIHSSIRELNSQKYQLEREISRLNGELNKIQFQMEKIARLVAQRDLN